MSPNPQNLITFTEEIIIKSFIFCAVYGMKILSNIKLQPELQHGISSGTILVISSVPMKIFQKKKILKPLKIWGIVSNKHRTLDITSPTASAFEKVIFHLKILSFDRVTRDFVFWLIFSCVKFRHSKLEQVWMSSKISKNYRA